eukprot:5969978-Amphidinium_carterae.1
MGTFRTTPSALATTKEWQIVGISKTWVSFYAKSLTHRVTEVTEGTRYSVTYYTPGNLDKKAGFPIDEVIARLQFFGMTLYRGVAAARQGETTDTSSTSEQKPVSFVSVVSTVTAPAAEEKSTPSPPFVHGCHLCGQQEGGSCCSMCHKTACSQHIRVKIDQKAQQALPICRSCSFLDETTRLAGLLSLPLALHELTGGIKALDCLCASTTTQPSGSAKSFQDVLSDRMGLSGVEETDPSGVLARAAVTMYELMSVLREAGLTNHLPHALVRVHHLQKMMKGVEMKDMAPLVMASPELVNIMRVAHEDPKHVEEVRISGFRVPWNSKTELSSVEDITARRDDPGKGVLSRPGSAQ